MNEMNKNEMNQRVMKEIQYYIKILREAQSKMIMYIVSQFNYTRC